MFRIFGGGAAKHLYSFSFAFRGADPLHDYFAKGEALVCVIARHSKVYLSKVAMVEDGGVIWDDIVKFNVTLFQAKEQDEHTSKIKYSPKEFQICVMREADWNKHDKSTLKSQKKIPVLSAKLDLADFAQSGEVVTKNSFIVLHTSSTEPEAKDSPTTLKVTIRARETHMNSMNKMSASTEWQEIQHQQGSAAKRSSTSAKLDNPATSGLAIKVTSPGEEDAGGDAHGALHGEPAPPDASGKELSAAERKRLKKERRKRIEEKKEKMNSFRKSTLKRGLPSLLIDSEALDPGDDGNNTYDTFSSTQTVSSPLVKEDTPKSSNEHDVALFEKTPRSHVNEVKSLKKQRGSFADANRNQKFKLQVKTRSDYEHLSILSSDNDNDTPKRRPPSHSRTNLSISETIDGQPLEEASPARNSMLHSPKKRHSTLPHNFAVPEHDDDNDDEVDDVLNALADL